MKAIVVLIVAVMATSCLAQPTDIASKLAAHEKRMLEASYSWQKAKKLSLIVPIPELPQPQFASGLIYVEVADESIGSIAAWDLKVESIIDNENMILRLDVDKRIWLQGIPTTGLTDDQSVRVIDHVQFNGTKSFTTVSGSKATIRVAKPLSPEESMKRLTKDIESAKDDAKYVVWRRKKGGDVNGKFLSFKSSVVTIETRQGEKIRVPAALLTEESLERAKENARTTTKTKN